LSQALEKDVNIADLGALLVEREKNRMKVYDSTGMSLLNLPHLEEHRMSLM
jgi:hypothetical protein